VGEPVWTTDTKEFFVGDGSTPGGIKISGGSSSAGSLLSYFSGTVTYASPIVISPSTGKRLKLFRFDFQALSDNIYPASLLLGSNVVEHTFELKAGDVYGANFTPNYILGGIDESLSIDIDSSAGSLIVNVAYEEV